MTLPLERARSRRPVTWFTLIGILLLPVVIGGILIAALYNPVDRLGDMRAAIVNNDKPVTVNGQYVPLGRQLSAGLVKGSDDLPSNLDWTISNTEDAAAGLADGTYDAVITIPENFSAAATSTAPGGTPERALISAKTSPDSLIVDDAITAQVASAAASVMGEQLSSVYLENVFLGFTQLGDQLGTAADGAHQLADGASQASSGAISLADGVKQLSTGAAQASEGTSSLAGGVRQLSDGAAQASAGTTALAGGVGQLADGADQLADGAAKLAAGAQPLASGSQELAAGTQTAAKGLTEWSAGARATAQGAATLSDGLQQTSDGAAVMLAVPQSTIDGLTALSSTSANAHATLTGVSDDLARLAADCAAQGGSAELCAALSTASDKTTSTVPQLAKIAEQSSGMTANFTAFAQFGPQLAAGLQKSATGALELSGGVSALADGADQAATGSTKLAAGMSGVADGASQLAGGATQLSGGMTQWAAGARGAAGGAAELSGGLTQLAGGASSAADGASELAGGLTQLAGGASSAADGASGLADGVGALASGTGSLADGLTQASTALPSYTKQEADSLAAVVANPVGTEGTSNNLFGASAIPLLAMLALWFGGLASFIALQAVPRHALSSRRPSALLAVRSLAPAAAIGAAQGLLVAVIVQLAAGYDAGSWWTFAGIAVLAGVAFAAVNQALVAVFGGAGRWVSALVGVLAVATGIVSTVPGVLTSVASLMPTTPAYTAMLSALTSAGGLGAGAAGMIVWAGLALLATIIAVARRRTADSRMLLRTAPALA